MIESNWSVLDNDDPTTSKLVFIRTLENGSQQSCFANHAPFQQWLRDNADNLPTDIQAKVEAGELVIQEADSGSE
jgi:hypothetical protein